MYAPDMLSVLVHITEYFLIINSINVVSESGCSQGSSGHAVRENKLYPGSGVATFRFTFTETGLSRFIPCSSP